MDRRDGPLEVGQADGVACRTVEMFETFGLADRLVDEAYWVNEVGFWRPDPEDRTRITRTGRVRDTEEGLSEFPHVIVNQARMLAYLLEHMERSPSRLRPALRPARRATRDRCGRRVVTCSTSSDADGRDGRRSAPGTSSAATARAAPSRAAIGRELVGDATNETWGVMDVLAVTDFPDIRVKSAINSPSTATS